MSNVPERIALLAARHRERFPHRPLITDHDIRVNDLRRLTFGDNDSRLVLIRSVHDGHVVVALVHPYTEYAASCDLVYERDGSFPAVVQNDLLSCALHEHVTVLVDRLPDDWEEAAWSGPKLMGPLDARWTFKACEGDTLRSLTVETWLDLTENL
jgi:hypothetical protein